MQQFEAATDWTFTEQRAERQVMRSLTDVHTEGHLNWEALIGGNSEQTMQPVTIIFWTELKEMIALFCDVRNNMETWKHVQPARLNHKSC